MPGEFDLLRGKYAVDQMPVQHRVHWSRRRRVLSVCSGNLQECYWLCQMHRLRRREVLRCCRPDGRKHVCFLPRELAFAQRGACADELRLQCGTHGPLRRGVRRVRGGDVQGSCWLCPVRDLRRREVLAPCDDLELFNRLREV